MGDAFSEFLREIGSWKFHIKSVKNQEDLTDKQKHETVEGMNEIRKIFDDDWLKDAVITRHPFVEYLINRAPWSRLFLADFGSKLKELRNVKNFNHLVKKLKNKDKFDSAESELQVASKINRVSLDLEFYPRINGKEPDLEVSINHAKIYCEITSMQTSQHDIKASEVLRELSFPNLSIPEVIVGCKVYKILSKPHIRELKKKINKGIKDALAQDSLIEVIEPGVIEYFICPRRKVEEIRERNPKILLGTCKGPPLDLNEPKRIRRTIAHKNTQLPEDKPGVIIIYNNNLFGYADIPNIINLKEEIEESIYEYENLIFAVIINTLISSGEDIIHKKSNYISIQKIYYDLLKENTLIIKNKYSKFRIEKKLINAFT